MTEQELQLRQKRAEALVSLVRKVDGGYRVYSSRNPDLAYFVSRNGRVTCTCPDFEKHGYPWLCKHILGVVKAIDLGLVQPDFEPEVQSPNKVQGQNGKEVSNMEKIKSVRTLTMTSGMNSSESSNGLKGIVEKINEKGIKLNGSWYNFSKFSKVQPPEEGQTVEIGINKNFISELAVIQPENNGANDKKEAQGKGQSSSNGKETKAEGSGKATLQNGNGDTRQVVVTRLACLNTATEVLKTSGKAITHETLFKAAETLETWVWRGF